MNPSFKEQLKDWKRQHQESVSKKKKHHNKSKITKTERLSESDIRNLMGANMRTLRRGKGGAWK
ncbi:hypothetical protein KHA94_16350 [Bacillus sp. FJAT-49705]|uniref:Phage protein n=1 Tax=Cytobacillus citreus TaxID=2833586 RepID=A0ABS5NV99_9BACI|nr:hypothetical protein [Cytobacillus citreus]MBS4191762.1 hypothetical protein [Cytobacillus citreus]